jgi:hypothetical protein
MSKNLIAVLIGAIFLIGSVIFSYTQKSGYFKASNEFKIEQNELKDIITLQRIWKAKGVKSKINSAISSLKKSQKLKVEIKKSKAYLSLANLNEKELNRVLSKLSSMPIKFESLDINKINDNFTMECKCDW